MDESVDKERGLQSCSTQDTNLQEWMRQLKVVMTLDPDTASQWLIISEDHRHMRSTETEQAVPDNPKRFTHEYNTCVLGSQGFTSGRHYWEVQELKKGGWRVGVIRESVNRKEEVPWFPEGGLWAIDRYYCKDVTCKGLYEALTNPPTVISLSESPRTIGVYLDYEGGQLSLYNADSKEHLYTFTQASFSEKILPFFGLSEEAELMLV
ncbi:E3 ubiquitin-protein ligase TRIM39-like [Lissotriton helveticus]